VNIFFGNGMRKEQLIHLDVRGKIILKRI